MTRPPRRLGMTKIWIGTISRDATADEIRAIARHLDEYSHGDKHTIRDEHDQSLLLARPQLRCKEDGAKLTVPVRIL